jgi:hypothetical protein
MWKATWHSDILPAQPPTGAVAMITAAETTVEMAEMGKAGRYDGTLTQIVDFAERFDQTFRISDPNDVIAG